MARDDGTRTFTRRLTDGSEAGEFTGQRPRQAAMKVARRLEPADSEAAATPEEIKLRERGTDDVHVYDAWAWREAADDDAPEWLGDEITEANVSKKRVEDADGGGSASGPEEDGGSPSAAATDSGTETEVYESSSPSDETRIYDA